MYIFHSGRRGRLDRREEGAKCLELNNFAYYLPNIDRHVHTGCMIDSLLPRLLSPSFVQRLLLFHHVYQISPASCFPSNESSTLHGPFPSSVGFVAHRSRRMHAEAQREKLDLVASPFPYSSFVLGSWAKGQRTCGSVHPLPPP